MANYQSTKTGAYIEGVLNQFAAAKGNDSTGIFVSGGSNTVPGVFSPVSSPSHIGMIIHTTTLDTDVLNVVCATAVNGVIQNVISGSDKKFYVVNMVEADPENFREEAIDAIANTVDLYQDSLRYYLKEYNFKISDTYTHELFEATYPDYIFD